MQSTFNTAREASHPRADDLVTDGTYARGVFKSPSQMKTETKLKQFKRFRTLEELKAQCKKHGWKINTEKHDREGSDFVSFDFKIGAVGGFAMVSTFNGRFFGELKTGELFNGSNSDHENCHWFQMLLETIYTD